MGIDSLLQQNMQNAGLAGSDRLAGNAMFPQSQQEHTQFATPTQMPTSAEVVNADYDAPTNAYTGMPTKPFAAGGIAALRFDEGGSTPAPWDPVSGQVILQKYNPQDSSADPTQVAYTIPKDSIKTFVANTNDSGQADPSLGGQYILNDGSTMSVGGNGIVQSATPARNDYTLNKDGYYQPTGSDLTWNGQANLLTKNIGGVDVQVPGMYTKGGYQDQQGNLRTDANGVPIALAPNYLDSGAGKSGLSDAAPYIAAALMGGAGIAMAPEIAAAGFAGMVPESETLMGGIGALGAGGAETAGATTTAEGAGAGGAASQGMSLQDAYNAYKYANMAKNAMGLLSGTAGGVGGQGGSQGIAGGQGINPMASTGFNPGPVRNGLGITDATSASNAANVWSNLEPSINLSKISDFKYGATPSYATGGMAHGGGIANLGSYSDGGQLLKGPGDGMSDHIPATIGDKQPARLAEGEFVVPADVVSHLGNGSTDAGAKQLYKMMDNIRKARTGNPKQGKQINPAKFLPKG